MKSIPYTESTLLKKPADQRLNAPALVRGIAVLRFLADGEPRSLDAISRETSTPKSSLLRILGELIVLDLIGRDAHAKEYTARARLVPLGVTADDFAAVLDDTLRDLAATSGQTAEWYVPGDAGLVLVRRAEAPGRESRVMARVGFTRNWQGEFDAVAQIGHAWFSPPALSARKRITAWEYDKKAARKQLPIKRRQQLINRARKTGSATDTQWNTHGVQRYACVVLRDEQPAGVLVLGEVFSPAHPHGRADSLRQLQKHAARIFKHTRPPWSENRGK